MTREGVGGLLLELEDRGVELFADEDGLRWEPGWAVTPELRERITQLDAELIALLRSTDAVTTRAAAPATRRKSSTSSPRPFVCAQINPNPGGDRNYPCYCCGSSEFWALTHVRHWVCAVCHAPEPRPPSDLIWLRVPAPIGEEPRCG